MPLIYISSDSNMMVPAILLHGPLPSCISQKAYDEKMFQWNRVCNVSLLLQHPALSEHKWNRRLTSGNQRFVERAASRIVAIVVEESWAIC